MQIGNVKIENKVFLAPMAGVTDLPFRLVCKKYGAGLVYSEMVSSKALYYKDKKTKNLLVTSSAESPLAVQIFGSDPEIMASTAYMALETGAKIIDINFGCPAPKVVNGGDGSAVLKDAKLIEKIVKKVSGAVNVPVTCKIRSGFDKINALETSVAAEAGGAKAITVHPRTRDMYYSGQADWDIIRDVKNKVSIPVIGNGDITQPHHAKEMLEKTDCDFLMVGRGAMGNPFLIKQINDYLAHGKYEKVSIKERFDTMLLHMDMLFLVKGEYVAVREARKHIAWYIKGLNGAAKMRDIVNTISDFEKLKDVLKDYYFRIA